MTTRITYNTMNSASLRGLQAGLSRVATLQEQLSSGKRMSSVSDDPTAAAAAMRLRSAKMADDQYQRNSDQALGRLTTTDTALTSLSDRVRSVRDLMVASNNAALNDEGRSALAGQIDALRQEVISLYNTTYLDRPVFGGSAPGSQAIDPASGAYLGNDAPIEVRISADATVRMDTAGSDAAADVLPAALAAVATSVRNGGATGTDFADIDAAFSKIQRSLGDVGSRTARLESTQQVVESHRLDLNTRISENEDVDLPETIMNLQAQQVGYQAALGATAKVLQTSLLDFLR